jgi:hypothetical protein
MRDVELLIRQLAFRTYLPEYRGKLKAFLDFVCDALNGDWATHEQVLRSRADGRAGRVTVEVLALNDKTAGPW